MERKAPFALSEGKLLSNSAHPLPAPVESLADCREDFYQGGSRDKTETLTSKCESCITCFAGIPKSGCLLPASQSKVGGVQMLRSPGSRCCGGSKLAARKKKRLASINLSVSLVLTPHFYFGRRRRRRQTGGFESCLKFPKGAVHKVGAVDVMQKSWSSSRASTRLMLAWS